MARWTFLVASALLCATLLAVTQSPPGDSADGDAHGGFTGEVKVVFYVRHVGKAVSFYTGALGFEFHHFYDHVSGGSVRQWPHEEPPIYAEMSYAGRRFGLHSPTSEADERSVGAAKIYFRVQDLDAHHRRTAAHGAKPGEIRKRAWMDMFRVVDPDGNRIYFAFTEEATHGNPWCGD